jgi:drug/metabolite transporter (DMT)-like permease
VIGLCAGAAALAAWRRPPPPATARRGSVALRTWYRALFALSLLLVAFLVFGSLFVALVLRVDVSNAFVAAFLASVVALPATIVIGMRVPGAAQRGAPAAAGGAIAAGRGRPR